MFSTTLFGHKLFCFGGFWGGQDFSFPVYLINPKKKKGSKVSLVSFFDALNIIGGFEVSPEQ